MPTASAKTSGDRAVSTVTALTAGALLLLLVTPRTSPGVLALLAVAVAVAAGHVRAWPSLRDVPVALGLVLALGVWAAASTSWAADRGEAISKALMLLMFALAVWWTLLGLPRARPELLRQAGWAALATFAACLVYLCFEELSNHLLKRLLFMLLPFTRPAGKHLGGDDTDLAVSGYITNRNMAAAMLALWPMLLMVQGLVERSRRLPAMAALLALALATFALSMHETSVIALALSALVLLVGLRWPRVALVLVAGGWLVATLLVVPIASWASASAKLYEATWLPNSARHRIVLWAYTAEQVRERPLIGVGAASTKLIDARRGPAVATLPGTKYQWRSGPHAHNVYLQVWYELGAVGAMLLCAAGLALIRSMAALPRAVVPYVAAAMTSAAVMGAFTWSLWQAWFLGAFAVSAALSAIAVQIYGASGVSANGVRPAGSDTR